MNPSTNQPPAAITPVVIVASDWDGVLNPLVANEHPDAIESPHPLLGDSAVSPSVIRRLAGLPGAKRLGITSTWGDLLFAEMDRLGIDRSNYKIVGGRTSAANSVFADSLDTDAMRAKTIAFDDYVQNEVAELEPHERLVLIIHIDDQIGLPNDPDRSVDAHESAARLRHQYGVPVVLSSPPTDKGLGPAQLAGLELLAEQACQRALSCSAGVPEISGGRTTIM